METNVLLRKLWEHPDPESTQMWKFMQEVNRMRGRNLEVRERFRIHTYMPTFPAPLNLNTLSLSPVLPGSVIKVHQRSFVEGAASSSAQVT